MTGFEIYTPARLTEPDRSNWGRLSRAGVVWLVGVAGIVVYAWLTVAWQ